MKATPSDTQVFIDVCMKLPQLVVLIIVSIIVSSCHSGASSPTPASPTTPSASAPPPAVSVSSIAVTGAAPKVGQTAQFTATATLSNGTTQVITAQATWQSSNTSVITVSTSGAVTGVGSGEGDVTAAYGGATGSQHVTVTPQTYALVGTISETSTGRGIAGARVEVLNGLNAGQAVSTDANGAYVFNALLADSFRMRASANTYDSGEQGVTVPTVPRADFMLRPSCSITVAPLRLWVTSGGMVSPSTLSIAASAPTCAWTASNLPTDWMVLSPSPIFQQSQGEHSVPGSGSAIVFLDSGAVAYGINSPQRTSTIRVVWQSGEVDVIACQPDCLAP
jgi:hypothetical protein